MNSFDSISTLTPEELERAERLRNAVGVAVRAVRAAPHPLPQGQIETLGFLVRDGEHSIAALARRRGVRHQSMSSAVAELEAGGLVERRPDPADARGLLIAATDAGVAAIEEERRLRAGTIALAIREALDEREREVLDRLPGLLERIAAAVTARDADAATQAD
ncbi:DNA-binding MarR family transcriptional regulator [Diaminobutyricimonas aerilata]|uniref:DNA-binding MarR family transcriptional regulator n=1 Tax=Diaminobutyricimonas aerilata TaxID=1162967 RepID=A0A2M9CM54_9MICO|nr:MarR family winged helix-turn-helix transcriptional regulator [Diaminobutyricimonas aerilata]PJJ72981.1 DNA-binding MarR family transcriptional regulator [Diaminobutyricimonas aerilata]